MDSNAGILHLS